MKNKAYRFITVSLAGISLIVGLSCQQESPPEVPQITTLPATGITTESASSGGNVTWSGSTPVMSKGVVWGTRQGPDIDHHTGITMEGGGTGPFISILTNLMPGTEYFARSYAVNLVGVAYGNEVSFTTKKREAQVIPSENLTDADGNRYPSVKIGQQIWMAENLRTTRYANGASIEKGLGNENWQNAASGAYAIYPFSIGGLESDFEVLLAYGALYNWHAVDDQRQLCPTGWEVPSEEDWAELAAFLMEYYHLPNEQGDPGSIGNALKSCFQVSSPLGGNCAAVEHPRWNSGSTHFGTDGFGFAALPGSMREASGSFRLLGSEGAWWTSTAQGSTSATYLTIKANSGSLDKMSQPTNAGMSIRCIKK